MILSREIAKGL